ncbi:MAG TPA: DinB family protein [Saprospiraceae bacterium]|nr:DinB family protein [Saprospiraceae bacterium]HMQ84960.1 DinB family protein [Saprospiraceae bacterium]
MRKAIDQQLSKMDEELRLLLDRMKSYSDNTLNQSPGAGHWSVLQIMQHLMLAEQLSLNYVKKKLSYQPKLPHSGLGSRFRIALLNFYQLLPLKFKAPTNVGDEKLKTNRTLADISAEWLNNRAQLRSYLNELPDELFHKAVYKHPFAGRLSLGGMLSFFSGHFGRHRKQIERTLQALSL